VEKLCIFFNKDLRFLNYRLRKSDRAYCRKWQPGRQLLSAYKLVGLIQMIAMMNFLRSLLLSIIFSFAAPMFLFGGVLLVLFLVSYIPGLQGVTETVTTPITEFLSTFGSGTPVGGLFVICSTCSFVGALFDTYAYYRYQILR
jgi:hypothetical protein